jgi:hypothetical protein
MTANGASGSPAAILGTPAYWISNNTPTVYVVAANDSLKAFPLTTGTFSSPACPASAFPSSESTDTFDIFAGSYGASPVISSNNATDGIVWALDTSGYLSSPPQPAILHAYDATNLGSKLYSSPTSGNGAAGLAVKFAVPTVANGRVYIGTRNELSVFGH